MLNKEKSRYLSGKKLLLLTLFVGSLFAQTIDANKSFIKFKVRNMGVRDVIGTITNMHGIVKFDSAQPDSTIFDVTVNVNTINTNDKKRDAHLKNEDFFETNKWTTIRFKSVNIKKQGAFYGVMGYLTIKDITKQVFVPFKIEETDDTIKFTGGNMVNRLDYNVGVDYNNFKIGFELSIEVVCVVNKDK